MIVKTQNKEMNNKNSENEIALIKNKSEVNFVRKEIRNKNIDIKSVKNSFKEMNKISLDSNLNFPKICKTEKESEWIIKEISFKDWFISLFFCCGKKRRNVYNILLNESKNVIMEKLDIFNIFKKIYSIEHSSNDLNSITMSEDCLKEMTEIIKQEN